ncbi:hypothetical protein SAMD00019534_075360, partial [Acytostelium subglobosum LB1]|uniref:hypothetical protein n=1 Tax=Acytostelium subglobosum LB1 TaxID=1410327 RepID=UPI0006450F33
IVSMRSLIVYANFLFVPFVLCFLWLLLPLHSYNAYAGTSMVFFVIMFFTWISFYDLNLPGCSKIQIVFFYLVFIGVAIGWLNILTKLNAETNRLSYSFIDAITWFFTSLCYLVYIFVHKIKKQYFYHDEPVVGEDGVRRRKRRSKPWTKRLSKIFCYYKVIDIDEDDQQYQYERQQQELELQKEQAKMQQKQLDQQRHNMEQQQHHQHHQQQYLEQQQQQHHHEQHSQQQHHQDGDVPKDTYEQHIPAYPSPTGGDVEMVETRHVSRTDNNTESTQSFSNGQLKMSPSMMVELMPKYQLSYRNFLSICVFQLFVIATWFWLHNLTTLIVDNDLFSSPAMAFVAILVFHISRLLLSAFGHALNRLLKPKEIRYFTYFQYPLMFFLYYRNLFLSINNWGITVLVSLVLFVIDFIYYPLHMTKRYWFFRHQGVINFLDRRPRTWLWTFLRAFLEDKNPSYDQHVRDLSVEYYYDKMAEYVSIVTMVVFLSLLRGLHYKIEFYNRFDALSHDDFLQLLWRYLYLLCFEVSYDLLIRFLARRVLKIDISHRGRNETISNFTTRFIFTLFLLYDLMDVYYIQARFKQ